jgi:hypothetical protein
MMGWSAILQIGVSVPPILLPSLPAEYVDGWVIWHHKSCFPVQIKMKIQPSK